MRLLGIEFTAFEHQAARRIGTDALSQAARAQHDAKLRARKAKRGARRRQPLLAYRKQIGPRAPGPALRHCHGADWCMPQQRQQGFDTHQALQQIAIARRRQIRQVQTGAKVFARAAQHQRVDGRIGNGLTGLVEQVFDQGWPQRIAQFRAIQCQRDNPVFARCQDHAATPARTSAERSHRLGTTVWS